MIHEQSIRLAKLVMLELVGFIIIEVLAGVLLMLNILPQFLAVKSVSTGIIEIHTGFILVVSLIVLLTSALEIAILVELAGILEVKKF